MDKVTRLVDVIRKLIENAFTGYIKINFTQGNIGRVEKFEELDDAILPAESKKTKMEEKEYL
ncbi:hypothetical protein ER57_05585 [Smithella sp. SCADC]|jgi:hypothetical protein|nr:hypothetical protein ER57_05585 [Smithella sp. SCADC]